MIRDGDDMTRLNLNPCDVGSSGDNHLRVRYVSGSPHPKALHSKLVREPEQLGPEAGFPTHT